MKLGRIILRLALAGLLLTFVGCEAPRVEGTSQQSGKQEPAAESGSQDLPKGEPVYVGLAAPFTGDNSEFGVQIQMGVNLAVEQLNQAGGIDGRPIKILREDDAGNPADAQTVATKLATNPKVVAVVGHFNSSCSLAGKNAYTQAKMVMFSPGSTNVTVTQESDYVFRNIFTDDFQGQSLADYTAKMLGLTKVAILFDNDDYGTGLKESFKKRGQEIGLTIVRETAYGRDTNDFRSQLTTIKASEPEIILIAGLYKQAAVIARQARELGIRTQLIGGDGVFSQQYITLAGQAAEGTFVTCPFLFDLGGQRAKDFAEAFRKKYSRDPDAWAALSYDAIQLLVKAMKEKGVLREAILESLQGINSPETAFDGLTGKTFFDAGGDCKKAVQVAQVKDGKFVAAEKQLTLETAPPKTATADTPTTK
jgi:branched-chain amino acid transport system substrate-binding protein